MVVKDALDITSQLAVHCIRIVLLRCDGLFSSNVFLVTNTDSRFVHLMNLQHILKANSFGMTNALGLEKLKSNKAF